MTSDWHAQVVAYDAPVYVISVAAELAGMHPQTLRQYDRLGLVSPTRAPGRGRRYSLRDVAKLREVQRLSQDEGVNLAGIKRIIEMQSQVDLLGEQIERLQAAVDPGRRVFAAGSEGDVVEVPRGRRPAARGARTRAVVVWRPPRS